MINTRNALMEELYERLTSKIGPFTVFSTSQKALTNFLQSIEDDAIALQITSHSDSLSYRLTFQGMSFDLFQLYEGEKDTCFFALSPPAHEEKLDVQIELAQILLQKLAD